MPKSAALALLIGAYRDEIQWLLQKAGTCGPDAHAQAAEYLTRAENLQGFVEAYDRLDAKGGPADK